MQFFFTFNFTPSSLLTRILLSQYKTMKHNRHKSSSIKKNIHINLGNSKNQLQ